MDASVAVPLEDFDFARLDSQGFKEDSVREEIIHPLLNALGYAASGLVQVATVTAAAQHFQTILRLIRYIMLTKRNLQLASRLRRLMCRSTSLTALPSASLPSTLLRDADHSRGVRDGAAATASDVAMRCLGAAPWLVQPQESAVDFCGSSIKVPDSPIDALRSQLPRRFRVQI
jgi:hypothetical protein